MSGFDPRSVAALYVDRLGPYPKMAGVDAWDIARDARLYDGPHPVVAHPPCRNYSKTRAMAKGDDSDCAIRAVEQVRKFGGVLEHPAGSLLWSSGLELPRPGFGDRFGGYTIEEIQVEWGHVARKPTWIYCVGVPSLLSSTPQADSVLESSPFPDRKPTHWASGFREHSRRKQTGQAVPPGIKVCSAQQRRRTPQLFAEYLVRLARSVRPELIPTKASAAE